MNVPGLSIAIAGHTNVGKTSLVRTLTRARDFGEVSARPATTRGVEMARIAVPGSPSVTLYDTPGLEDSSGLLAYLDGLRGRLGLSWADTLDRFCADPELQDNFEQEAKALAQVRACDVALYVIDSRQRLHAKYRDELEILSRCARPVLPVFNFIAAENSRQADWRTDLAKVNMHAIAAFDTVLYDEEGELALYGKIATLCEPFAPVLDALTADVAEQRRQMRRACAYNMADMLVSVTALQTRLPAQDDDGQAKAVKELKAAVRTSEQACVDALLAQTQFARQDYVPQGFDIQTGQWLDDPFDPDTLKNYGLQAGRAAATGAAAGVGIDLMVGGITLGAAAATGAAIGFLADVGRKHGRTIMDRLEGRTVIRADNQTIRLLALRQIALTRALLARGHGAQSPVALQEPGDLDIGDVEKALKPARRQPGWSKTSSEPARATLVRHVGTLLADKL